MNSCVDADARLRARLKPSATSCRLPLKSYIHDFIIIIRTVVYHQHDDNNTNISVSTSTFKTTVSRQSTCYSGGSQNAAQEQRANIFNTPRRLEGRRCCQTCFSSRRKTNCLKFEFWSHVLSIKCQILNESRECIFTYFI